MTFSCARKWDHYATDVILLFVFLTYSSSTGVSVFMSVINFTASCVETLLTEQAQKATVLLVALFIFRGCTTEQVMR